MARAQSILPGLPRKTAKLIVAPVVREPILHKQIADTFRLEIAAPLRRSKDGVIWFSIDIAGYVGAVPGIRTSRGVVAGVPDIIVLFGPHAHWIEVKALDGSLSPAQAAGATELLRNGCRYGVATSAADALALLDAWEIPRAHRIRGR
jgi:hypothetical protein